MSAGGPTGGDSGGTGGGGPESGYAPAQAEWLLGFRVTGVQPSCGQGQKLLPSRPMGSFGYPTLIPTGRILLSALVVSCLFSWMAWSLDSSSCG